MTEERSFVEAARREKRAALEALGVQPFAYRYRADAHRRRGPGRIPRTTWASGPSGAGRRTAGSPRLARQRRPSPIWRTPAAGSSSTSGRTQLGHALRAGRTARPGRPHRRAGTAVPHQDGGDHRSGRIASAAGQVAPAAPPRKDAADGETVRSPSGPADPELRYRQRYADLAVHPEVRADLPAPGQGDRATCAAFSMSVVFSRSRRRSSSHSMAARRPVRS